MSTNTYKPESSPALTERSRHYPASWHQRVPRRVKMAKTVFSDRVVGQPISTDRMAALAGQEYDVWVNSHGAVTAILHDDDNRLLGLNPYEFEVIAWHEAPATSTPEHG